MCVSSDIHSHAGVDPVYTTFFNMRVNFYCCGRMESNVFCKSRGNFNRCGLRFNPDIRYLGYKTLHNCFICYHFIMPYKDNNEAKKYQRDYYNKNKERKKKQAIDNYYDNHEKRKKQKRDWAERNKEKLSEYRKRYAPLYRKRKQSEQKARWTLGNAIRNGKIKRPNKCSICGKNGLIHAHHDNYNKPLEVVWVCHQCHFKKHRRKIC